MLEFLTKNALQITIALIVIGIIFFLVSQSDSNNNIIKNTGALPNENKGTDSVVNSFVEQNTVNDDIFNDDDATESDMFKPNDPMSDENGPFNGGASKRQLNFAKTEQAYAPETAPSNDTFTIKNQKFVKKTPEELDSLKLLPSQTEDWWDIDPLLANKKIKGTQYINPAYYLGNNTVRSSKKIASHEFREVPPNPRMIVTPFNNSSYDPDTNIKGFSCPY